MTNEQAIKELQGHKGIIIYPSERMDAALDMAISALNSLEEVYAKGYNDGFTQAEVNFENDKALSQEPTKPMCDRNICIANEYNGIGCDECIVNNVKQEPCDDTKCGSYNNTNTFKSCSDCKLIGTDSCYMVCGGSKSLYKPKQKSEPCDDTVSIRKDVLKCRVGELVAYNVEWLKKHWQMEMEIVCGVKPCDDAISRDAVLTIASMHTLTVDETVNAIRNLPCVTQMSRMGHWIDYCYQNYRCSECDYIIADSDVDEYNFCPNCGARMESEDKE